MTECNLFCFAEIFGDKDSVRQEKYRAFNKVVGEGRWKELRALIYDIFGDYKLDLKNNTWLEAWEIVPQEIINKLAELPEYDTDLMLKHCGVKAEEAENDTIILDGVKYRKVEE